MMNAVGYGFGGMTPHTTALYYGTYSTGMSAPYSAIWKLAK
jgi:hypothetical protein